MNCRRFQNRLHEYLDGALSVRAQGAADRHLARCAGCRQSLGREHRMAQVFAQGLRREPEAPALRPDLWRLVLEKVEQTHHEPMVVESAGEFWTRWAWPLAISVSLLVIIGITVRSHFSGPHAREREAGNVKAGTHTPVVSALVSYPVPVRTFRQDGDFVVDCVAYKTALADETLWHGRQAAFHEN